MNKINLKRWTIYISIAICSSLVTFSILSYIRNNELENKIKEIESTTNEIRNIVHSSDNKETTQAILDNQYKESIFLSQLSNNTTIILSTIGFIIAFGGILSFKNIDDKFISLKKLLDINTKKQNKKINLIEKNNISFEEEAQKWVNLTRFELFNSISNNSFYLAKILIEIDHLKNPLQYESLQKNGLDNLIKIIQYTIEENITLENSKLNDLLSHDIMCLNTELRNLITNLPSKRKEITTYFEQRILTLIHTVPPERDITVLLKKTYNILIK